MKKIISALLVMLMVLSCLAGGTVAFAEDTYSCTCEDCKRSVDCTCCVYCTYSAKVMPCLSHDPDTNEAIYCCEACTGFLGCRCGEIQSPGNLCECPYCRSEIVDETDPYAGQSQIISSDVQKQLITTFRNVLNQVSGIFDRLFNAIFEFLRIAEFENLFR